MNQKIVDMLVIGVVIVILICLATVTMGTKVYEGFEEMHRQEPDKSFLQSSFDKIKRIFINIFIYFGLMSPDSIGDDDYNEGSFEQQGDNPSSTDLEDTPNYPNYRSGSGTMVGYEGGGSGGSGGSMSSNMNGGEGSMGYDEGSMGGSRPPRRPQMPPRSGMPMPPRNGMPMPPRNGMPMPSGSGMPTSNQGVQSLVPQTSVTMQPNPPSSTQSPRMMSSQPAKL